jgi:hypothetical protein
MFQRWRNYDVGVMDLADLLECSICLGQEESSVCPNSEQHDLADPNADSGPVFLYVKPCVPDPDLLVRDRIRLGILILPSKSKKCMKTLYFTVLRLLYDFFFFEEMCIFFKK